MVKLKKKYGKEQCNYGLFILLLGLDNEWITFIIK